jgi:hypothetical protein
MSDQTSGNDSGPRIPPMPSSLTPAFPINGRSRRRRLPFLIRHSVVIVLGAAIGLLASYALRKAGF